MHLLRNRLGKKRGQLTSNTSQQLSVKTLVNSESASLILNTACYHLLLNTTASNSMIQNEDLLPPVHW